MTPVVVLRRLHQELGAIGVASLALIAAGVVFLGTALTPLEVHSRAVEHQLAADTQKTSAREAAQRSATPLTRLEAFYRFLESERRLTDWLDRLYAAAAAAGVEPQSADYRLEKTGTRIDRYEIRLPLRGRYTEVRKFIDTALAEIPVLSLDEVKFRRDNASEARIEAELRLTLHLLDFRR